MMYEKLKQSVKKNGEVMIQFDSGNEAELHKHNTEFLGNQSSRSMQTTRSTGSTRKK